MDILGDAVANVLQALSEKEGIGVREIGRDTGIHPSKVSRLLGGQLKLTLTTADLIARRLGTNLESILKTAREEMPDLPARALTAGEAINWNIEKRKRRP